MNPREEFDDELFELERRIARRADELSRLFGVDRGHSLEHWRRAEREVLEYPNHELATDSEALPR